MGEGPNFGALLRRQRELAGLTQEELAERAGITAKGISALERGARRRPYPHTLRALADALGLSGEARASFIATRAGDAAGRPAPSPAPADRPWAVAAPPGQLTTLVGRDRETDVVLALLARPEVRLLTLTGPGGIGKTRLALRVAEAALASFPAGVFFVPLVQERDPHLVLAAIGRALEVDAGGDTATPEQLALALTGRRILLVLDNFEHLLDAALPLAELLARCPELHALVTSRSSLHIRGEQEYRVPPLEVPGVGTADREVTAPPPAVALFAARAAAVRRDFTLDAANIEQVAAICRRLDGLPLAIELAAARIAILPPAALLARLDVGLQVLSGGPRDLHPRQRTMRDAIAWSYDLLTPAQRALFRALAVCVGTVTIETIEALAPPGVNVDDEPFVLLAALVDCNLLQREDGDDDARFGMLETVRAFAGEQLAAAGELAAVQGCHADHFAALILDAEPHLTRAEQTVWVGRLERDWPDIRAAVQTLLARDEAGRVVDLAWALWRYWWVRGPRDEARRWMAAALRQPTLLTGAQHGRALVLQASLALGTGAGAGAAPALADGLARLRLTERPGDLARALLIDGLLAAEAREEGRMVAVLEESARLFDQEGAGWGVAFAQAYLGQVAFAAGDLSAAERRFAASLAAGRADGDRPSIYHALHGLGLLARERGAYADALRHFTTALTLAGELRDGVSVRHFIEELAEVATSLGAGAAAERLRALGSAERGYATAPPPLAPPARLLDATTADRYDDGAQSWARLSSLDRVIAAASALTEELAPLVASR